MPDWGLSTLLVLFAIGWLSSWQKVRALSSEVDALADAVTAERTRDRCSTPYRLRHPRIQAAWLRLKGLQNRPERFGLHHCLSLIAGIPQRHELFEALPESLCRIIREFGGLDVTAAAVLTDSREQSRVMLRAIDGAPRQRVGAILERIAEKVIEHSRPLKSAVVGSVFRQLVPIGNSPEDFSLLGIGRQLVAPVVGPEGCEGAIWIGLSSRSGQLSPEQFGLLEAVVEFASTLLTGGRRLSDRLRMNDEEHQMLLGISHDLRAPGATALYALHNLLESQSDQPLSPAQRLQAEAVQRSLRDQLRMVNDLLDLSRANRKNLCGSASSFPIGDELLDGCSRLRPGCAPGVELRCGALPALTVRADRAQMRRVIENLIGNAVKYTERGSIEVSLESVGGYVRCTVADTGIGVPAEDRERLFDGFERGSNVGLRTGCGIGLAISRRLVELQGGRLFYSPTTEGGSIFTVELPAAAPSASLPSGSRPLVTEAASRPGRVLVVDDEPASARAVARLLMPGAASVRLVHSLREAEEAIAAEPFDTLVTDLHLRDETALPLLDSFAALPTARQAIIVTGAVAESVPIGPNRAIPVHIVEKPITREGLLRAFCDISGAGTPVYCN